MKFWHWRRIAVLPLIPVWVTWGIIVNLPVAIVLGFVGGVRIFLKSLNAGGNPLFPGKTLTRLTNWLNAYNR